MAANDEIIRLVLQLTGAKDLDEAAVKLKQYKDRLEEADVSQDKLGKGSANTGQSLLQTGRVIQDFAQGGLGGILNNIEGLTMALGLGSGLAGVLTVVGVAALTAGPSIKSFFRQLIDGSNEIPESAEKVKGFEQGLKKTTERLEELQTQQRLTNSELAEFNRLTIEQTVLERNLEAARAAKKIGEALNPEQRAGADLVKRATDAFGGKRVLNEVARALGATGNAGGDAQQAARNLLFNVERGDVQAIQFMQDVMARGSGFTDIAQVLGGGATPQEEQQSRRKADERDARDRAAFVERKQKEKDELNAEVKQAEEDARQAGEDMDAANRSDREKAAIEARRIGNEAQKQRQQQRERAQHIDKAQKLQQVPMNADDRQAAMIMAQNQILLDAQIRADQQQLLQLARQARTNIQTTNRTAQTNGFPQ